jgi:hypothetical protein
VANTGDYLSRRVNRREAFLSQTITLTNNLQTVCLEFPGAVQPGQVTVQIQDPTAGGARRSAQVNVRTFRERTQGLFFSRIASSSSISAAATNRRGGFTMPFSGGLQIDAQRGSNFTTVLDIWVDFNDQPYASGKIPPISTQIVVPAGGVADAGPPPPNAEYVQVYGDRANLTGIWMDDAGAAVAAGLTGANFLHPMLAASGFHLGLANGGGAPLNTLVVWT